MKRKLPIYELKIKPSDDAIVTAVALVEDPAIESNFITFSKTEDIAFAADDERMELIGAGFIPNQKIYRRSKEGFEYEVFASPETVRAFTQEFFKRGYQNNVNLNHTSLPSGCYIYQCWITDKALGISAPKGIDVPDSTMIFGMKCENPETWKSIKSGEFKGFSIEGIFELIEADFSKKDIDEAQVLDMLQSLNNIIDKLNTN